MGFKSTPNRADYFEYWRRLTLFSGSQRQVMIWGVALAVMTIAVILRFTQLDAAVYWGDEVYSSLRIFGHRTTQLHQAIGQGQLISAAVLQSFQHLVPAQGLNQTLAALAIEDAHIAPLYFVLARVWASCFGDSAGSLRALAAMFGALVIPASYYLAMDLFNLPTRDGSQLPRATTHAMACWMMILVASSPLHFLMAREARGYSLWTLLTVLSSIFLLRALKAPSWERWGLFAIALMLNFYSNFLAIITFAGYLTYVAIVHWRDRQTLREFGVAATVSLMGFAPWAATFLTRQIVDNRDSEGVVGVISGRLAVRNWFELIRRLWIDFNTTPATTIGWAIGLTVMTIVGIGLIILGGQRIVRHSGMRVWLFLLLLTLPLPLCFFDRSLQGLLPSRYLLPSYMGVQLMAAYWLGHETIARSRRRLLWLGLMGTIVIVGLLSCHQATFASGWWNKHFSDCNPAIARLVNEVPRPLVISDGTGGEFFDHGLSNVLSVSRLVKPETHFQVGLETEAPIAIAPDFTDRFVVTPSQMLRDRLEQQYPGKLQPLLELDNPYRGSKVCLWRLLP
jgi:uncharacterized membrane protein